MEGAGNRFAGRPQALAADRVQNAAWSEKLPEITKQSALAMNREFLNYPLWNEKKIEERGRGLLAHALVIWPR